MHHASHVEITFRDEYLTRADMWRLVVATLSNRIVRKGQRIRFMGTIKALVQSIFIEGQKVDEAIVDGSTKPIFRSESARYTLFIQMSKEMWDFDADSTGEIMFSKVINGFLPELFDKWKQNGVRHLISIVLFTRLEREQVPTKNILRNWLKAGDPSTQTGTDYISYQDFYRVVVSDMASGQWASILEQLKVEFKVFLKDISLSRLGNAQGQPLETGCQVMPTEPLGDVIAGRPSAAIRGNILEAINLASSQFSCDHIDRDLVRTGVSIAVITPGTGVFEVNHRLLVKTTENLIENGVGIDLICLSGMPLHSIPLFKYWKQEPSTLKSVGDVSSITHGPTRDEALSDSGASVLNDGSVFKASSSADEQTRSPGNNLTNPASGQWYYGIPHWIDVSFWTSSSDNYRTRTGGRRTSINEPVTVQPQRKVFVPRMRMYQLQMMGATEDAMGEISIPFLPSYTATRPSCSKPYMKTRVSETHHKSLGSLRDNKSKRDGDVYGGRAVAKPPRNPAMGTKGHENTRHYCQWMDEYDEMIFKHPTNWRSAETVDKKFSVLDNALQVQWSSETEPTQPGSPTDANNNPFRMTKNSESRALKDQTTKGGLPAQMKAQKSGTVSGKITSGKTPTTKPVRLPRQLSFGPLGLSAGALKATASTELSAEHAKSASSSNRVNKIRTSEEARLSSSPGSDTKTHDSESKDLKSAELGHSQQISTDMSDFTQQKRSRPISIRKITTVHEAEDGKHKIAAAEVKHISNVPSASETCFSQDECEDLRSLPTSIDPYNQSAGVAPGNLMMPWLTVVNPSNPHKMNITLTNRLGRWQHVFPRPLRASKIKWKSLCSPAAVPLTTEDFPSSDQITTEYEESRYRIFSPEWDDLSEKPRSRDWLLKELVAFRFSQGFQVVVGSRIAESRNISADQMINIFEDGSLLTRGNIIFMSRGSLIHELTHEGDGGVAVKQLTRRGIFSLPAQPSHSTSDLYQPAIRTMHANEYATQEINIFSQRKEYDWEKTDSFIANHEKYPRERLTSDLRSWCARFVLIPVDPPLSGRRPLRPINEDDEEEARLEGIRKLTQLWQRFRYVPSNERRFQVSTRERKDTNPLDIMYWTRNPSVIVAAELDSIGGYEPTGKAVQLLPDTELYQRSDFNLAFLAQVIQSEKGVRMMDRRWHWKLHYNCFIGFELTTWLLDNFRDVETRDEAVELGNELMKSGLFHHVEHRHDFRDGNFFYQIASEYHAPRPESGRNWFGSRKTDASVPSTPISESIVDDRLDLSDSRASSSGGANDTNSSTPTRVKQRLGVALSKSLLYDVDSRKRSHRPEIINLHYDRLHNPDNCYHIRIDWMNVTAKFIEDAVSLWATSINRFRLRLVEVPLGEAASITKMHPFRAPSLVKLAQDPPVNQPQTYLDATSFKAQHRAERHFYQKAILKHLNFVLDFEAARDFPSDVDVTYSWGKPDYKFPQYIHRSGVILAQITDDGDFLLLANRLYHDRSIASQDSERTASAHAQGRNATHSPGRSNHRGSPRSSPYTSPSIRATQDVLYHSIPAQSPTIVTAEQIKSDFESFCHDEERLSQLYQQVLSKGSSPGPNTPFMEGSIPALGLPSPSFALGEATLQDFDFHEQA